MRALSLVLLAGLVAGGDSESQNAHANAALVISQPTGVEVGGAAWPDSLKPFGAGYPRPGDACRQVGESTATRNYLDDSATLVGCPSAAQARSLGGRIIGVVDGITLVSVPAEQQQPDAIVPGTGYHATSELPCSLAGKSGSCTAGVKRGPDQIAVEVRSLQGKLRTLLFDGSGRFVTHASSEADGSAALQSSGQREEDWTIITLGTEQYRVPEAFLLGG